MRGSARRSSCPARAGKILTHMVASSRELDDNGLSGRSLLLWQHQLKPVPGAARQLSSTHLAAE